MARTKEYGHYCPATQSLEVVGEKWSIPIVRDLLFGPLRFTDLRVALGGITPKWLSLRLRDLEAAGIVERDHTPGRREVWYRLTAKGRALEPVVEALLDWGLQHARPPQPGDVVHPWRVVASGALLFNRHGIRLPRPATWVLRVRPNEVHALQFDGDRWSYQAAVTDGDLEIETTLKLWLRFLKSSPDDRVALLPELQLAGNQERIDEFTEALIDASPQ